jgi:thaumarchaeosortase
MSEGAFSSATAYVRKHCRYFKILMIFLSVGVPLTVLYFLYPLSFDKTFNGRGYYLFFVWLLVLEFVFDWDKYGSKESDKPVRNVFAFSVALTLPTVYVVISNFLGLNAAIIDFSKPFGIVSPWLDFMPLATEFLVFTVLFAVAILCTYDLRGLRDFSLPIAMLGVVGAVSMINLLFPYGGFTPFQILVPMTANLSAGVLNLLGYKTWLLQNPNNFTPTLYASNLKTVWGGNIAWPCAGVDSLLIYSVVILLFLKKADFSRVQKIIYFIVGATVAFFINVLRIVTIYVIGVNSGGDSAAVSAFHDSYGQIYSAIWIVSYPLIIIGSQILWSKLHSNLKRASATEKPSRMNEITV